MSRMSGIEISSSQGLKKPPKMSPREEKAYLPRAIRIEIEIEIKIKTKMRLQNHNESIVHVLYVLSTTGY